MKKEAATEGESLREEVRKWLDKRPGSPVKQVTKFLHQRLEGVREGDVKRVVTQDLVEAMLSATREHEARQRALRSVAQRKERGGDLGGRKPGTHGGRLVLDDRILDIVRWVAENKSDPYIARECGVTPLTVLKFRQARNIHRTKPPQKTPRGKQK